MSCFYYVNDMVLVGIPSVENLLTVKAIVRYFELTSGLKVNIAKSYLYGVSVGRSFLDRIYEYLHCKVGSPPFKYLGILMDGNSKKVRV